MMSKLRQIAVQVINGIVPLSTDELAAERQKVCDDCEFMARMTNQCKLCWCFLDMKTKVLNAECPEGKW